MRKNLLPLAIAAASLAALPALSRAADAGGFFANLAIGQSNADNDIYKDTENAGYGNIGYRWALSPAAAIGVEGGYTNIGSIQPKSSVSSLYPGISKAQADGWNLGVNGHFNFTPQWYASARAGGYFADLKGAYFPSGVVVNPAVPVYVKGSTTDYYAGLGFGYDFSNNFSLGVNYDYYKASKSGLTVDPYIISVSGEFRFGNTF